MPDYPPTCCNYGGCQAKGLSASEHCEAGLHCTWQEPECAVSKGQEDHSRRCCECGADLADAVKGRSDG